MEEMRERFEKTLSILLTSKRDDNKFYLNQSEYEAKIHNVKMAKIILKTRASPKSKTHYRLVNRYDILTLNGKERLIKPFNQDNKMLFYVTNEELFDILYTTHIEINHGGRNRMAAVLKEKYCNITKEIIMIFLRLCIQCQQKTSTKQKNDSIYKPLPSNFNSSSQIDFIDMQSRTYNKYLFVLVHEDMFTKFILLKALKSKEPVEVASHLLDIYTTFGVPALVYSNDGEEFLKSVITELCKEWKDVRTVPGRSCLSQSSEERTIDIVEEMLNTWMMVNGSQNWPSSLKHIQFQRNCAFNTGIGRTPYEAMFGCPARIELASSSVAQDELPKQNSEDDDPLEDLYQINKYNSEIIDVKPDVKYIVC